MKSSERDEDTDPNVCRRNLYKLYYETVLIKQSEIDVSKIIASLHDTWSEIRKDSSKYLTKVADMMTLEELTGLLELLFANVHGGATWQVCHGSLMGMAALSKAVCHHCISKVVLVRHACVATLSHPRLPIREGGRHCIYNLLKWSILLNVVESDWDEFYNWLLKNTLALVKHDVDCSCEENALELDGLLGCLIDAGEEVGLVKKVPTNSEPVCRVNLDRTQLTDILYMCLGHPSSTVRQRAAEILTMMCVTVMSSSVNDQSLLKKSVGEIVKTIHSYYDSIAAEKECDWRQTEGVLLVADELLAAVVSACVDGSQLPAEFRPLVQVLHVHMSRFLTSNVFEVRRAYAQLVPSLARLCVCTTLITTDDETMQWIWTGPSPSRCTDDNSETFPPDSVTLPPLPPPRAGESSIHPDSSSAIVSVGVFCGWVSELLKCVFTMASVWSGNQIGGKESSTVWSCFHVPRRLGEADRQRRFIELLSLVRDRTDETGRVALYSILMAWLQRYCPEFLTWLCSRGSPVLLAERVLCPDFIEAAALLSSWHSIQQSHSIAHEKMCVFPPNWLYSLTCMYLLTRKSVLIDGEFPPALRLLERTLTRASRISCLEEYSGDNIFRIRCSVFDPSGMKCDCDSQVKSLLEGLVDFLLPVVSNIVIAHPDPDSLSISIGSDIENIEITSVSVQDTLLLGGLTALLTSEFSSKLSTWQSFFQGRLIRALSSSSRLLHVNYESGDRMCGLVPGPLVDDDGIYEALALLLVAVWRGVEAFLRSKNFPTNLRTDSISKNLYLIMWESLNLCLDCAKSLESFETTIDHQRLDCWKEVMSESVCFARAFVSIAAQSNAIEGVSTTTVDEAVDSESEFSDWDDDEFENGSERGDAERNQSDEYWKTLSEDVLKLLSRHTWNGCQGGRI